MARKYLECFSGLCFLGKDNDINVNANGYSQLLCTEETETSLTVTKVNAVENNVNDYFQPINSYQRSQTSTTPQQHHVHVSNKLRCKKICKRIKEVLRSTWKWCKLGSVAVIPNITPFVMIHPFQVQDISIVA
uniref:Uncharacterized protein n=1 Tax=Arion vulgaris TaxID=1028688 RepID=A0A0B7BWI0_9EUPU